jgi:hypothetical protein
MSRSNRVAVLAAPGRSDPAAARSRRSYSCERVCRTALARRGRSGSAEGWGGRGGRSRWWQSVGMARSRRGYTRSRRSNGVVKAWARPIPPIDRTAPCVPARAARAPSPRLASHTPRPTLTRADGRETMVGTRGMMRSGSGPGHGPGTTGARLSSSLHPTRGAAHSGGGGCGGGSYATAGGGPSDAPMGETGWGSAAQLP